MFKKMFNLIKKFIVAVLLIYAYNKMALPLDLFRFFIFSFMLFLEYISCEMPFERSRKEVNSKDD